MLNDYFLEDSTTKKTEAQAFSGNRCGHDPKNPRFFSEPSHHKNKPWLIKKLITRLIACFFNPNEWLVNLLVLNETFKKKRTERLEAICCVAQVLIYFTDFSSFCVGVPQKRGGQLSSLSLEVIAKHANISLKRVKRAMRDLIDAGYVESTRQIKRHAEGVYESFPSIKKLTREFFYHMGIKEKELKKMEAYKKQLMQNAMSLYNSTCEKVQNLRKKIYSQKQSVKRDTEKIPQSILSIYYKKVAFLFR